MQGYTATYSPEDNKLRLYAAQRLSKEEYERVRAAGFIWAPKQELFVAPAWTPGRVDLLEELAGEIGDEDKSLVDRAEQRAERFEDYSESRAKDAEGAHKAVASIADNIPFGQPILVGHHSEKHARKDAERIENGMRRAVKMWETSQYWQRRAAGAISSAKYKERPDVRARRIKGLEAEARKIEKSKKEAEMWLRLWELKSDIKVKETGEPATILQQAQYWANRCHLGVIRNDNGGFWTAYDVLKPDGDRYAACPAWTPEQVRDVARIHYPAEIAHCQRWLSHLENRLTYERAMLADAGGTVADRNKPEKGGACKCWASPRGGWSYIQKVNKVSVSILDNWGNAGGNFARTIPFDKLAGVMSASAVQEARDAKRIAETKDGTGFFLAPSPGSPEGEKPEKPEKTSAETRVKEAQEASFDAMRETLKAGVQVVTAPQLFPTPEDLANRMVEIADIRPGQKILEPSAGTGNILQAIYDAHRMDEQRGAVAVEINPRLAEALSKAWPTVRVKCGDFLECNGDLGKFDRIVMNPPFTGGQDIKHIQHALTMLKPGGRLVAICANGSRQNEKLRPLADEWIELEPETFKESGTLVNAALLVITA